MNITKKMIISIMIAIASVFIIAGMNNKVFADYGLGEWNKSYSSYYEKNHSDEDWRGSWDIWEGYGSSKYHMHCNFACYVFDNIYCIQRKYKYQDDVYKIRYRISIEGKTATLYDYDSEVGSWTCDENNIMAGIVSAGKYYGKSVGIRINGGYNSGTESDVQLGVHKYWGTFQQALNNALGTNYKWGFTSHTSTGLHNKIAQEITNNGIGFCAEIVIMQNTKGSDQRQNLIGVEPGKKIPLEEKTSFTVQKEWKSDSGTGMRPSGIKITLYGNDVEVTEDINEKSITNPITLTSANASSSNSDLWSYTFDNLPKTNSSGKTITYTAEEEVADLAEQDKFDAYTQTETTITNGSKFTNTLELTDITVTKKWDDNKNQYKNRPSSIKINLYDGDGKIVKSANISGSLTANTWTLKFSGLQKYKNGELIKYVAKEDTTPNGYENTSEGNSSNKYTITNTTKLTNIDVTKNWADTFNGIDDFDEIRPDKITVQLYENGTATNSKLELTAKNNWKGTFKDLPEYKNKNSVTYTVKEIKNTAGYTSVDATKANGYTITNTHSPSYDGYTEITGTVWFDGDAGKGNTIDGKFDNEKEKGLEGIIVRLQNLKDEKGNPISVSYYSGKKDSKYFKYCGTEYAETATDGTYTIRVNYNDYSTTDNNNENNKVYNLYEDPEKVKTALQSAYVEFEYDGMTYTTVANATSGADTSKTKENEIQRSNLDNAHQTVTSSTTHPDNWTDKNITASTQGVISFETYSDKTTEQGREETVRYCDGTNYQHTNQLGAWKDIVTTKDGHTHTNCTKSNPSTRKYGVNVEIIQNVNLGLFKREQPDVAIFSDLNNVKVTMNGQEYTYWYNVRSTNLDPNNVGIKAKFQNKNTYTYRRPVNPADIAYLKENNNDNLMSVEVTYEVKVANLSSTLVTTIQEIKNFYDPEYTLKTTAGWTETTGGTGYKCAIGNVNKTLQPLTTSDSINLTYTVSADAIKKLLNDEATLNNAVEITSFSTAYGKDTLYAEQRTGGRTGKPYAGYDYNSHPGNVTTPKNRISINSNNRLEILNQEDDEDIAPSFVLCLDELTTLAGTVWEDTKDVLTDEGRIGDGKQGIDKETGEAEKNIQNVKVELYNSDGTTLATRYDKNGSVIDNSIPIYTDTNGNYQIPGVITGNEYIIKYTYGNDKTELNGNVTTITGSGVNINARDYKSTIITDPIIKGVMDNTNVTKLWPLTHTDGYSVAVDNMQDRLSIGELTYATYDIGENMTAYTKPFIIKLEFDATDDKSNVKDQDGDIVDAINQTNTNILDTLDFGIIERPREQLLVQKTITNFKITLANGQVLTEGNPNVKETKIDYAKTMGFKECNTVEEARKALEKRLLVEIDAELIQGAHLDVTYQVKVINNNEIDYDYGTTSDYGNEYIAGTNQWASYYYYGVKSSIQSEMTSTVKIVDYLDSDLVYSEDTTKWVTAEANVLKDGGYINPNEVYNKLKEGEYKILTTPENTIKLQRGVDKAFIQTMTASKLLANQDDNAFDNHAEIIEIDGKTARTVKSKYLEGIEWKQLEYRPGNYEPGGSGNETDDDKVDIIITPPTGITNNVITYIITIAIGLTIIVIGVIFIKKKVLIK